MIMYDEIQGLKSQIGELISSHDARVSRLMEVNEDLQLRLDAKDAERDAEVEGERGGAREGSTAPEARARGPVDPIDTVIGALPDPAATV
jgi:hypothetical protein